MKNNMIATIVIVLAVAGVSFFAGGQFARNGQRNQVGQGRRGMGGATVGEIVSLDAQSITVKMQDGSSKIVNIAGSTTFSKTDTAAKTDLKTGERIAAFGTSNADGSVTAQNIQLNPLFRAGQGMRLGPSQ